MPFDREDHLRRVRALLKQADDVSGTPEADVFRARAEAMMLKYRIEQAELGEDHTDNMIRDEQYDFNWYSGDHGGALWLLLQDVALHCNVKVVHWQPSWRSMTIPVVGTDSDRAYFDALFTGIMLEFMKGLEPQPDPNKTMIENLVALKEAGQKWLRIAEQLHRIGQLTDRQFDPSVHRVQAGFSYDEHDEYPSEREARLKKQVHHLNFSGQYTSYCKKNNRPRLRVTPTIYQRSFKIGFTDRMAERLREIRLAARRQMEFDSAGSSNGLDLVLADARTRANHRAIELYGQPPSSQGRAAKGRSLQIDPSAVQTGREAANRIDLGNHSKIGQGRGELTR